MDIKTELAICMARITDKEIIVEGTNRYTFKQWGRRVYAFANALQRFGVGKGDHVLIGLRNREEMCLAVMSLHILGAIAVPYNWRARAETVAYFMRDSEAVGAIFEERSAAAVEEAVPKSPGCRLLINVDGKKPMAKGLPDVYDLDDCLRGGDENEPRSSVTGGDVGMMLYTSGTTGEPKGVALTHENTIARALGVGCHHGQRFDDDHRILGLLPLFHTFGLHATFFIALIYYGTYYPIREFKPEDVIDLIEREKITDVIGAPVHFHDLLEHPNFQPSRVASLRSAFYGGAAMSTEMIKAVASRMCENFTHVYGNTETYEGGIYRQAQSKPQALRTGTWHAVRIVKLGGSPEDVVPPGEDGALIVSMRSPESFTGYWKKPAETAKSCKEGWFYTGDSAKYDPDGAWYVTGRTDDMINSGGENIHPLEVEHALELHPDVSEAAVVGIPDKRLGQAVKAFVVAKKPLTTKELDEFLIKHTTLDRWKRPKEYQFIEAIPRTASGKIQRFVLREQTPTGANP